MHQWARVNEKELETIEARRRGAATILTQAFLQWLRAHMAGAFRKWRKTVYDAKMEEARARFEASRLQCLEIEGNLNQSTMYGRKEESRANIAEASLGETKARYEMTETALSDEKRNVAMTEQELERQAEVMNRLRSNLDEETEARTALEIECEVLRKKIDLMGEDRTLAKARVEAMQTELGEMSLKLGVRVAESVQLEKERDEAHAVATALVKSAEEEEEEKRRRQEKVAHDDAEADARREANASRLVALEALYAAEQEKNRHFEDECAALSADRTYLLELHGGTRKALADARRHSRWRGKRSSQGRDGRSLAKAYCY